MQASEKMCTNHLTEASIAQSESVTDVDLTNTYILI